MLGPALAGAITCSALAQPAARRDAAWDAVFTRDSGWNGGDIAHSIDLGDDRTLWLFGDSIVGPIRDGARVGGESAMVRSAIAWHAAPGDGPPAQVHFAIPDPGHIVPLAEWMRPAPGLWPENAWYWLMNDGEVVSDAEGVHRFVLFATAIGPSGNPEGMWNFRRLGGVIMTISNPADPPRQWRAAQRRNSLVGETPRFGESAQASENWALAIVAWPPDAEAGARMLYVYGLRSGAPGDNSLLVARCPEDGLDAPDAWTFFNGQGWSDTAADAAPIASGFVDEFTVEPLRQGGRDGLILIQSEPMLGRHILARAAGAPEGPWTEPTRIHTVAEPDGDARLITYAARGHAHLSRPGELLVTYAVNSTDFGQIFRDASLYRPRFLRVPIDLLPTLPDPGAPPPAGPRQEAQGSCQPACTADHLLGPLP